MPVQSGMVLSKLDKQTLRRIVTIAVTHTGIGIKEGTFRYSEKDIARQLAFGGDFTYGFGDFFKLLFVRYGTRKSTEDNDKYDILFRLAVELDNVKNLSKDSTLYLARLRIADETEEMLEAYLKESGLAEEARGISSGGSERVRVLSRCCFRKILDVMFVILLYIRTSRGRIGFWGREVEGWRMVSFRLRISSTRQ